MTTVSCIRTAALKPRARAFADYWLSLPRTDLIPYRRDFEPGALAGILNTFLIFEIVAPDHFLVRLAGTTVIEHYGREITGQNYLDFRTPQERPITRAAMTLIATHPCGQLVSQAVRTGDGKGRISESFGLPMRDDAGRATLLYYQVDDIRLDDFKTREERYLLEKKTAIRHFIDIGNGIPDFPHVGTLS
ncbi:PAS domain-containing protein [Thalassobaculum salexigens]|uniref:PAS domain-containing protein n=1 Tax=Thalassobaculum salexigens TaxID=455360 RepID=UPI00248EE8EE|nr:PAS domain-containing protein [Thalassobaculum salexigens]